MSINTQSDTVRSKEYSKSYSELEKVTVDLINNSPYETCISLLSYVYPEYVFIPNWKFHGFFKSKEGAIKKGKSIIKTLEGEQHFKK